IQREPSTWVNPRYPSWLGPGYVVHNTRQFGKWGWEERKARHFLCRSLSLRSVT
ncbi:hypothetical protein M9458_000387, partial [Cirrhinus mrigala]